MYRSDLEAAQARAEALEREAAEAKERAEAAEAEAEVLREKNARLQAREEERTERQAQEHRVVSRHAATLSVDVDAALRARRRADDEETSRRARALIGGAMVVVAVVAGLVIHFGDLGDTATGIAVVIGITGLLVAN